MLRLHCCALIDTGHHDDSLLNDCHHAFAFLAALGSNGVSRAQRTRAHLSFQFRTRPHMAVGITKVHRIKVTFSLFAFANTRAAHANDSLDIARAIPISSAARFVVSLLETKVER